MRYVRWSLPIAAPIPAPSVARLRRLLAASMALALAPLASPVRAQGALLHPGGEAQARRCYAQQDAILGAVRRYRLEWNREVTEIPWDRLIIGGFLGSLPVDPGSGPSSETNYLLTGPTRTGITCSFHGSREAAPRSALPGNPTFDPMVIERCRAQQHMILGAMSLLNLETNSSFNQIAWTELREGFYLTRVPEDPGEGVNSYPNYALAHPQAGGITCMRHGPLLGTARGFVGSDEQGLLPEGSDGVSTIVAQRPELGLLGQ